MTNIVARAQHFEMDMNRIHALRMSAEALQNEAAEITVLVIAHLIQDQFPAATALELRMSDEADCYVDGDLHGVDGLILEEGEADDDGFAVESLQGPANSTPCIFDLVRSLPDGGNWERFLEWPDNDESGPLLNLTKVLAGQ